jgi:hypothetical protein
MKKNRLIFISSILIILLGSFWALNDHWKRENKFYYQKGSDVKAIFNVTWEMSKNEIERMNDFILKQGTPFPPEEPYIQIQNKKRITHLKISRIINLWGNNAEIMFDMFDDRLFQIRIFGNYLNETDLITTIENELIKIYSPEYKKPKLKPWERAKIVYERNSDDESHLLLKSGKDSVRVELNSWSRYFKNRRYQVKLTYLPFYNEISNIAKIEQNSIFPRN